MKYFSIYKTLCTVNGVDETCWELFNPTSGEIFVRLFINNGDSRIIDNDILGSKLDNNTEWIPDENDPMYQKIWEIINDNTYNHHKLNKVVVFKMTGKSDCKLLCYLDCDSKYRINETEDIWSRNQSTIQAAERNGIIDSILDAQSV